MGQTLDKDYIVWAINNGNGPCFMEVTFKTETFGYHQN